MPKVLILGAGASFGHGAVGAPRPPLAKGFFNHPASKALEDDYEPLFRYLQTILGLSLASPEESEIESVFGKAESTWKLGVYDSMEASKRFGEVFYWITPPDLLRSFVTDLISITTLWLKDTTCPAHDYLASRWLSPGDFVVSFNYDLMMDFSLKSSGRWNESTGYGFHTVPQFNLNSYYDRGADETQSEISLLKLHGSLNWSRPRRKRSPMPAASLISHREKIAVVSLHQAILRRTFRDEFYHLTASDPGDEWRIDNGLPPREILRGTKMWSEIMRLVGDYDRLDFFGQRLRREVRLQDDGLLPLMVMPTPYKPFDELTYGDLREVWRMAKTALQSSNEIVAIGFSFRDEHFNQLLKEVLSQRAKPTAITIVTRDGEVIDRTRKVFDKTRLEIRSFEGWMEDFVASAM